MCLLCRNFEISVSKYTFVKFIKLPCSLLVFTDQNNKFKALSLCFLWFGFALSINLHKCSRKEAIPALSAWALWTLGRKHW